MPSGQHGGCFAEAENWDYRSTEAGHLNPIISRTFALADFQQAMSEVLGRRSIGRIALVMDEEAKRLGL